MTPIRQPGSDHRMHPDAFLFLFFSDQRRKEKKEAHDTGRQPP
jgi:hypothetical protein